MKIGPILTHELLKLREKGLTIAGVDRIIVSVQKKRLWPLGPFSDNLCDTLCTSVRSSEKMV